MSAALPSDASMLDLYRLEAQDQAQILTTHLLALERTPTAPEHLEACMRAAHSLKGAARIVGFEQGVKLAHAMEDYFVAAQRGTLLLGQERIDAFLRDIDILRSPPDPDAPQAAVAAVDDDVAAAAAPAHAAATTAAATAATTTAAGAAAAAGESATSPQRASVPSATEPTRQPASQNGRRRSALPAVAGSDNEPSDRDDRMLRVTADHLTRLLRLAGESLVEARRRKQGEEHAHRLYEAALACRMRPFADGTQGFPRMVRDIARSLNKQVRLDVRGTATQVDRDILARLEAPLGHLLRNAVDHGIETPEERRAAGKPEEAVITLEARHNSGTLQVGVGDDGRGISLDRIRDTVIRRGHSAPDTAARLTDAELLEFLFLPGFTLKDDVTDVSGRGVGLDVVQDVLKKVRGAVRVTTEPGRGTRFLLQLPLTLSVERTLLVEVAKEPYALPLAQIASTARIERTRIEYLEGRPHYYDGQRNVGLIGARQLLRGEASDLSSETLNVVLLGSGDHLCALLVDSFLGERELVVQPLDPRLGKVKDVAAAAVMEDGTPVLILDVEDLIRSVEKIASEGRHAVSSSATVTRASGPNQRRRVLVVDDSLTVREIERKLLTSRGYQVDVATDGMDGWNAIRTGKYDLLVTDVDMPRMDGIELVKCVRSDPHLKSLPVMIVSYKDRPEDRRRGLDAGADHYLAKSSFHDEALLEAVRDLIGEAVSASLSSVA